MVEQFIETKKSKKLLVKFYCVLLPKFHSLTLLHKSSYPSPKKGGDVFINNNLEEEEKNMDGEELREKVEIPCDLYQTISSSLKDIQLLLHRCDDQYGDILPTMDFNDD